jgi:hypothetical protein
MSRKGRWTGEIGRQEMECEERRRQEEVVHRVEIDASPRGNDEHEEEEEQQRDRREEADPAGQRSWLKLLRQDHADAIARDVSTSTLTARTSSKGNEA